MSRPVASVVATAPVRIADVGGWTDTWFGAPGRVCHLAVGPGVQVRADLSVGSGVITLWPRDLGPARVLGAVAGGGEHPLLEHAVAEVLDRHPLPPGHDLRVEMTSAVPAGASLGTSAAVLVALLAALDALLGGRRGPDELARAAHQVETGRAGREAGVQDQWAAAHGGVNLLAINPYPDVTRFAVTVPDDLRGRLAEQVVTVVFGAHDSSAVHAQVIDAIVSCGGQEHDAARRSFRELDRLAGRAADALRAGSLEDWARVLTLATEEQSALHPDLVGTPHRRAIELARAAGALGWKVNGAGGEGGSLTIVASSSAAARSLVDELRAADPGWTVPDLTPAPGVAVTEPA